MNNIHIYLNIYVCTFNNKGDLIRINFAIKIQVAIIYIFNN